jgi:predicted tellurium resistance membrane protein TerC
MDILGIVAIPVITVICYLIAEAIKATALDTKWLPVICGFIGAILGVVALYVSPEITPATDILTAIAIGIVSGFASTGIHQAFHQFNKE